MNKKKFPRYSSFIIFIISSLLFVLQGCNKAPEAEVIFINGHIVTMNNDQIETEAFAVADGKFIAVGKTKNILEKYPNAPITDLEQKTVMPGIIESHGHLLSLGQSKIELNIEGIESTEEVIEKVKELVDRTPDGEWIIGWGWDDGAWAANYPENIELSKISPKNPVYLRGLHGFASWVNDKCLQIAGITNETPNPESGVIIKDKETGKPTGILTNEAQLLIEQFIPDMSLEQCERALKLAINECTKNGLTSIHEAKTNSLMLKAFRSLKKKNMLKGRIYVMLDVTDEELMDSFLKNGPEIDKENLLTIRCIKVFVDGALGSRGAAMIESYSDAPNEHGVIVTSEDSLYNVTLSSLRNGFQVATHAIGDRANRITLNTYKRALEIFPVENHRLRLEHAQITALEDIPKFIPINIVLSMQPPHATSDMPWAENRVGSERIKGAYAWRIFGDTGLHMTLNSDFPGETLNPFYGMYAAETRKSIYGLPEDGWYPEQCLTRDEVLKAYTIEAAYSGFEENIKGSIKVGMLADFIVISDDILKILSNELLDLKVEQTYLGGELVYQAK